MQQRGGGSQYGASPTEMTPFASAATDKGHSMLGGSSDHPKRQQLKLGDPSLAEAEAEAEAASPISSRPPATTAHSSAGNFEEPLHIPVPVPVPIPGGLPDEDMFAGEEVDRVGVAVGNRWPRQETLALLKIRSDMDAAFRDATLKGALWEDVSRYLADLGYKRSAKKCKEKFENVHKYYKRTKEGRGGRQDGKSYRFFSQLEALAGSNVSAATPTMPTSTKPTLTCFASSQQLVAASLPVSIGIGIEVTNPMQVVSSIWIPPPLPPVSAALPQEPAPSATGAIFPSDLSAGIAPPSSGPATVAARPAAAAIGVSFTTDSSASSSGSEELDEDEDEDEDEEMEAVAAAMEVEGDLEGEQAGTRQRKRQRRSSKRVSSSSSQRMMEFFEGLMKQVMQKQEGMQQRFLETIEKREQDRMIREEAWKRQEMARLAREHELMAQERAMSASRDAAIIDFLQKITGQTIQLPQPVIIPAAPPPPPPPFPIPLSSSVPPPPPPSEQRHHKTQQQQWQHYEQQPHHQQHQHQQQLHHYHHTQAAVELVKHHHPTISSEVVMAVPEQQVPPQEISGGASFETSSSRWPKAAVLALIKLRSGLESRYQEAGPKGPLWEEISAGMQRMGYKRSAKRCKEKWENINKYFKKVKESNKKRPADAKTCPYFHQLDALYRKKIIGSSSGGGGSSVDGNQNRPEQQQQQESGMMDPIPAISLQEMTDVPTIMPSSPTTELDNKGGVSSDLQTSYAGLTATLFGEGSCSGVDTGAKKPEDIVKEQQQKQQTQQLLMMDSDKADEPDNDIIDQDDVEEDEDDDDDDEVEMNKMAYKIEFQRQNAGSANGGGNGAPSFLAMVQ